MWKSFEFDRVSKGLEEGKEVLNSRPKSLAPADGATNLQLDRTLLFGSLISVMVVGVLSVRRVEGNELFPISQLRLISIKSGKTSAISRVS